MYVNRNGNLKCAVAIALAATAIVFDGSANAATNMSHLTVVELFQSQGCSSCPPANENVMALSDRADLITLSFGVTYWDRLGWKDTFASPKYTDRQWDYAHTFHRSQVFTPEVVVNGRADVVGRNRLELENLIRREANKSGPKVEILDGSVIISEGTAAQAQVWLVRFDPKIEQVPISRGENEGRTLPHRNVVKELVKLGDWVGSSATYRIPQTTALGLRE